MEYRTGSIGRVVSIRFDHGDDFFTGLREILLQEKIRKAWFQVIGALDRAGMVIGPKEAVIPPDPVWRDVDGASELIGCGSVYMDGDEPKVHLHGSLGEHGTTLTGCIRRDTRVYLLLEVVLFELIGIDALRPRDEVLGVNRVVFS